MVFLNGFFSVVGSFVDNCGRAYELSKFITIEFAFSKSTDFFK